MAINFDFLNVWKSLTEDEKKKLRDQAQGGLLDVGAEPEPVQEPQPSLLDVSEPAAAEPAKGKRGLFGFDPLGGILPEDPQKREDVLMAMMQGFGGMMAAGGPSREPTNFLQVAGVGLGTGVKGYADARRESREGSTLRATNAANQSKAEAEAKASDLISQWQSKWAGKTNADGSLPLAAIQELAQVYMSIGEREKAVSLLQEANTYQKKLNSEGMLIGEDGVVGVDQGVLQSTTDLSRAKDAGELTTDQKNYQTYVDQETAAGREPLTMSEWDRENKKAGATRVDVNGGGTDKQIFDTMLAENEKARQAQSGLKGIYEARTAVQNGGVFGAGADTILGLRKVAALIGVGDTEVIENTETFRSAIAPQVAAMLKQTVGSANISDSDRAFAEKAAGGSIQLDQSSILRLLDIMERANKEVITQFNGKLERVYPPGDPRYEREQAIFGGVTVPVYDQGTLDKGPRLLDIGEDGQKKPASVPTVNTVEDYHALPSGAKYLDPRTGRVRTKK